MADPAMDIATSGDQPEPRPTYFNPRTVASDVAPAPPSDAPKPVAATQEKASDNAFLSKQPMAGQSPSSDAFVPSQLTPWEQIQTRPEKEVNTELQQSKQDVSAYVQGIQANMQKRHSLEGMRNQMGPPPLPNLQDMPRTPLLEMQSSLRAFQSPLTWLAIAGSLLTRQPALNAMAAATGIMEGFHTGDQERIKLEQEKFKDNVERMLQQNQKEIQLYRAKWDTTKFGMDKIAADIEGAAADNKDLTSMQAAKEGNWDKFWKIQELKEKGEQAARIAQTRWGGTREQKEQRSEQDVKDLAAGIADGTTPPTALSYQYRPKVAAELHRQGVDLTQRTLDYSGAYRQVQSLNGPQMTRFKSVAQSVLNTIDEAKKLSGQLRLSGIPLLNRAELQSYIQTQGNSAAGQLATRYMTVINTLKEEFASVAQGGYAPTESAWKLAESQINGNYGVDQLGASLDEVRFLLNARMRAINDLAPNAAKPSAGGDSAAPGQGTETHNDPLGIR